MNNGSLEQKKTNTHPQLKVQKNSMHEYHIEMSCKALSESIEFMERKHFSIVEHKGINRLDTRGTISCGFWRDLHFCNLCLSLNFKGVLWIGSSYTFKAVLPELFLLWGFLFVGNHVQIQFRESDWNNKFYQTPKSIVLMCFWTHVQ